MLKRMGVAASSGALLVATAFALSTTDVRPLQLFAFFIIEPPLVLIGSLLGGSGAAFAFFATWLAWSAIILLVLTLAGWPRERVELQGGTR